MAAPNIYPVKITAAAGKRAHDTGQKGDGQMILKKLLITGIIVLLLFLVIFFLFRFARAAEKRNPADLAWLLSAPIAHRGLHDGNKTVPENSLPAFRGAIEKGYIIELDVAMTKDKKLVVYHDKKLRRGLGIDRYLSELTYEELTEHPLFGSAERIPLFLPADHQGIA